MKFTRDVVYSYLDASPAEFEVVKKLLTFGDSKESYLSEDGVLYTGLVGFALDYLKARYEVEIVDLYKYSHPPIKDIRIPDDYIRFEDPSHRIRDYQLSVARKSIANGRGIIEVATGGGKTEIASIIAKYLLEHGYAKKVYVLTDSRFLMNQAASRMEYRGVPGVSRFGGGHEFIPATTQVCVIDSVINAIKDGDQDFIDDFNSCDVVIVDECHHLQAETWVLILEQCKAKYRYGLTATLWNHPFEFTHSDFRLIGLTDKTIAKVPSIVLRNRGFLAEPYVTLLPISEPLVHAKMWDESYEAGIVRHPRRNSYIISLGRDLYNGGYKTLVFVKIIAHGLALARSMVEQGCKETYFVRGGERIYKWLPSGRWDNAQTSVEEIAALVRDSKQVCIIGTSVMDEGVDFPSFNALIMGTAMKKFRRTVQRVGRAMRPKKGVNEAYVFDFVDSHHPRLLEHSNFRIDSYEAEVMEMSPELADAEKRMGIPLAVHDGLFEWTNTEEYEEKRNRRLKKKAARKKHEDD